MRSVSLACATAALAVPSAASAVPAYDPPVRFTPRAATAPSAALVSGAAPVASAGPIRLHSATQALELVDLGDPGFSLGDESVFTDDLLTRPGGRRLGANGGVCVVVRVEDAKASSGTMQCSVTFALAGGQITTVGLVRVQDAKLSGTQIAAVTGGTGRYRGFRGEMAVSFRSNAAADVTFRLRP
jgi:hypothetical protein